MRFDGFILRSIDYLDWICLMEEAHADVCNGHFSQHVRTLNPFTWVLISLISKRISIYVLAIVSHVKSIHILFMHHHVNWFLQSHLGSFPQRVSLFEVSYPHLHLTVRNSSLLLQITAAGLRPCLLYTFQALLQPISSTTISFVILVCLVLLSQRKVLCLIQNRLANLYKNTM